VCLAIQGWQQEVVDGQGDPVDGLSQHLTKDVTAAAAAAAEVRMCVWMLKAGSSKSLTASVIQLMASVSI
jgi:hypothetical protein